MFRRKQSYVGHTHALLAPSLWYQATYQDIIDTIPFGLGWAPLMQSNVNKSASFMSDDAKDTREIIDWLWPIHRSVSEVRHRSFFPTTPLFTVACYKIGDTKNKNCLLGDKISFHFTSIYIKLWRIWKVFHLISRQSSEF